MGLGRGETLGQAYQKNYQGPASIGLDEPVERWEDFKSAWDQYKDEYSLMGQRLTRQLVACCSSDLSMSLSRATGGKHFSLNEATLLERMKESDVRFENPAVQVQTFLAINQQSDEGVRHFLSRLKGVATHCNLVAKCTCGESVSYADHVIRFNLVSGLIDEEVKEDILVAGELDLESTVKQIESKEGAKKAKNSLSSNGTISGQVSKVRTALGGSLVLTVEDRTTENPLKRGRDHAQHSTRNVTIVPWSGISGRSV